MAQTFTAYEERMMFGPSPEVAELQKLVASLPEGRVLTRDKYSGKLKIRLPKFVHTSLAADAEGEGTSLNQLVVSKLSAQLQDVAKV